MYSREVHGKLVAAVQRPHWLHVTETKLLNSLANNLFSGNQYESTSIEVTIQANLLRMHANKLDEFQNVHIGPWQMSRFALSIGLNIEG